MHRKGSLLVSADNQSQLKVFVSYSRKDAAFVERLEAALRARNVEPLIDRTEIYAFEDWWQRIEALIARADTIIFVLSPDSVVSDVCRREVDFARTLAKRFAPVVCRRVDESSVPDTLARLNFIFFDDARGFEAALDRLVDALETDIDWVRQHTEIAREAAEWEAGGRGNGLLLRQPKLERAEQWVAARPRKSPEHTALVGVFIAESRRDQKRRRRRAIGIAASLLLALGALAGFGHVQRQIGLDAGERELVERSRALARAAELAIDDDNELNGVLLALEGMPDEQEADRPVVAETAKRLFEAMYEQKEIGVIGARPGEVYFSRAALDGKHLLSIGADHAMRIWDAASGSEIAVLSGHTARVVTMDLHPDGKHVATGSQDGTARIWDIENSASSRRPGGAHRPALERPVQSGRRSARHDVV